MAKESKNKSQKTQKGVEKVTKLPVGDEAPTPFHNAPFKNHKLWYASGAVVIGLVVYASYVVFPYFSEEIPAKAPKTPVSITVNKPTPATRIEFLGEEVTAPMLELQERVAELQSRLEGMEETMHNMVLEGVGSSDPMPISSGNIRLSEMMNALERDYDRGTVTPSYIEDVNAYVMDAAPSEELLSALENLYLITPVEGPVTLAELMLISQRLLAQGTPTEDEIRQTPKTEEEQELSFWEEVKAKAASLVSVRAIGSEEASSHSRHPWVRDLERVQNALSRGDVLAVQEALLSSENLSMDTRSSTLSQMVGLYITQQEALASVLNAYSRL